MSSYHEPTTYPNLRTGLEIFLTRPISLVITFILSVIICVVSFMLLTFPVIAGYYYAVSQSRREEFFIDLPNVTRTISLLFSGIKRYFLESYVLGIFGLLPVIVLYIGPIIPWLVAGDELQYVSLGLMILWLPAFFLIGTTIFFSYPRLIVTNDGLGSLKQGISSGKSQPFATFARGFMLLYPLPGWIIHLLMILSYPIIASWAIASTGDIGRTKEVLKGEKPSLLKGVAYTLILAAVMVGACYPFVILWEAIGFIIWLIFCFIIVFIFMRRMGYMK